MKFKTLEEKKHLAERVLNAYKHVSGGENLYLTKDDDNKGYDSLIAQIQVTLSLGAKNQIPGVYALIDFFCDDDHLGIKPATAALFERFIKHAELERQEGFTTNATKSDSQDNGERNIFPGSDLIDREFMTDIIRESRYKPEHFYLLKYNYEAQWYGTFKQWDAKPYSYDETKKEITDSFKTNNSASNISAVICGDSGNGKSTFLRRLAFEFIGSNFVTLWITNLSVFILNIDKIKRSYPQLYLLIIEDWEGITGHVDVAQSFLSEATKLKNVRIVIADKSKEDQPYFDYFSRNKVLYLSPLIMMQEILERVFEVNRDWQSVMSLWFPETKFYFRTISIALFAIHTAYRKKIRPNNTNISGAEIQFLNTIGNDLRFINEAYPGLSTALVYWGYIQREFRYSYNNVFITWNVLFKLADFYNGNEKPRKPPKVFDEKIYALIMHYVWLEPLVHPQYSDEHIVSFNSDIIFEEGITKISIKGLSRYDKNIVIEMVHFLSTNKYESMEFGIAAMIADAYCKKYQVDIKFNFHEDKRLDQALRQHYAYIMKIHCRHTNLLIRQTYEAALESIDSPVFWRRTLNQLSIAFFQLQLKRKHVVIVLRTIIEKGCHDQNVARAYKISTRGRLPFLYCMSQIFHENAMGIDKNYYYDIMAVKPWGRKFKAGRWVAKREKFFKKLFISGNPTTENENTNPKN